MPLLCYFCAVHSTHYLTPWHTQPLIPTHSGKGDRSALERAPLDTDTSALRDGEYSAFRDVAKFHRDEDFQRVGKSETAVEAAALDTTAGTGVPLLPPRTLAQRGAFDDWQRGAKSDNGIKGFGPDTDTSATIIRPHDVRQLAKRDAWDDWQRVSKSESAIEPARPDSSSPTPGGAIAHTLREFEHREYYEEFQRVGRADDGMAGGTRLARCRPCCPPPPPPHTHRHTDTHTATRTPPPELSLLPPLLPLPRHYSV
jgi:hypothetical protein